MGPELKMETSWTDSDSSDVAWPGRAPLSKIFMVHLDGRDCNCMGLV